MADCEIPKFEPVSPSSHPCVESVSIPGAVRIGGRGTISVSTITKKEPPENLEPGLCSAFVICPGVSQGYGKVWVDGQFAGAADMVALTPGSHTVTFEPARELYSPTECPWVEGAIVHNLFGSGYYITQPIVFYPEIPLEPDEPGRAATRNDDPCPINALLRALGLVNVDGCATLDFLLDLIMDPLGLFGGEANLSYASHDSAVAPASMGWGWSSRLDARIEELENGDLVYRSGSSSFERWKRQPDGTYVPAHRNNYVKAEKTGSGYRLTFQDRTVLEFDIQVNRGRILRKIDRNGNELTYNYEPGVGSYLANVQDEFGRTMHTAHGNDGQITALEQKFGEISKKVKLEYEGGRLSAIVGPYTGPGEPPASTERVRFTYHGDGKLKQVIGPSETVDVWFDYYTEGAGAGKVRTERFHVDPATGQEQRRNTYEYDTELRRVKVTVEDRGDYTPQNAPRVHLVDYDERLNVTRFQDPLGNVTSFEYGDLRDPYLLTRVVDPKATVTSYTHNSEGLVTSITDPNGKVTRIDYYGLELPAPRPEHGKLPARVTQDFDVTVIEKGVRTTRRYKPTEFHYDHSGNLRTVLERLTDFTAPGAPEVRLETTLERNSQGQVTSIVDRNGQRTTLAYNPSNGNLASVTTPGTPGTYREQGLTTRLVYDPLRSDRVVAVQHPWGTPWSYEFDEAERLTRLTDPRGFYTQFAYEKGRLDHVLAPPNLYSDSDTEPRKGPDVQRKTTYVYDVASRLQEVLSDVGPSSLQQSRVKFRFDGLGNLREMVRRLEVGDRVENQTTSYSYDSLGRLTSTVDPRGKESRTEYDRFCNKYVHKSPRAVGSLVENTVTFDNLCRPASVEGNHDGVTSFEHDELGRLIEVTQPGGTAALYGAGKYGVSLFGDTRDKPERRTYEYDGLHRLTRVNFPDGKFIGYRYEPNGNLASVVDVHGRETVYTYFRDGRLWTVSFGGQAFEYVYDSAGRLQQLVYPTSTGIVAHYEWTDKGELQELEYRQGASSIRKLRYLYDPAGNRTIIEDGAADGQLKTTWNYFYDWLNRLEWVASDGEKLRRYKFDSSDNRKEKQIFEKGVLKETHAYSYVLGDRLTQVASGTTPLLNFAYDDEGNTVTREEVGVGTDAYQWTDAGALKTITRTGSSAAQRNSFDGGGIRKKKKAADGTETEYYYSGLPALSETIKSTISFDHPAEFRSHIVGHEVLGYSDGPTFHYFLLDPLGSVRDLVDGTGAVRARYTSDEFGHSVQEREGHGFATHLYDASSAVLYARARHYDAMTGRFLSKDPHSGYMAMGSSLNPYTYAYNNPVNLLDRTGREPHTILIEEVPLTHLPPGVLGSTGVRGNNIIVQHVTGLSPGDTQKVINHEMVHALDMLDAWEKNNAPMWTRRDWRKSEITAFYREYKSCLVRSYDDPKQREMWDAVSSIVRKETAGIDPKILPLAEAAAVWSLIIQNSSFYKQEVEDPFMKNPDEMIPFTSLKPPPGTGGTGVGGGK